MEILLPIAVKGEGNAMPCHRTGYDRYNIRTLVTQIHRKREKKRRKDVVPDGAATLVLVLAWFQLHDDVLRPLRDFAAPTAGCLVCNHAQAWWWEGGVFVVLSSLGVDACMLRCWVCLRS